MKKNALTEVLPDKIDRYRDFLAGKGKLSAKEEKMFEKYLTADKLLTSGYSQRDVVRIIAEKYECTERQAYSIVNDTNEIFGGAIEAMKKGARRVMYENFMRIARKAEHDGNYEAANSAYDKASKILGLYDAEPVERGGTKVVNVTFTTDPAALEQIEQESKERPIYLLSGR